MADETLDERLARIEAALAPLATKADLAGVATNVEIRALTDQIRRLRDDVIALKDEVTVTSAIAQRVDNVTSRLINDVLTEIRAEHGRMDPLLGRVRTVEDRVDALEEGISRPT